MTKANEGVIVSADQKVSKNGKRYPAHRTVIEDIDDSIEESFCVVNHNNKTVSAHFSETDANTEAVKQTKSTGNKHTVQYNRTASPKNEAEVKMNKQAGAEKLRQDYKTTQGWVEMARSPQERLKHQRTISKLVNHAKTQYGIELEEDINEINNSTVASYKEKATDELKQAKKYTKSEYGDLAKRLIARRKKGLAMANSRNESKELDEGSIKDAEQALKDHAKKKDPYASPADVLYHEKVRTKLLANKVAAQRAYNKRVNNESEELAEGILSRITNKVMGVAPKEPKYKVGQVVSYETPEDQPDWKDRGRGKGTITKYSNGHYIVNGNPVNHFDIKKVHESVDLDETKNVMPLKGHPYHTKSDHELRGIVKDAGEAAKIQKGMSSEGKYLDQMNDASTVLHYRSKGGARVTKANEGLDEAHKLGDRVKIVGGASKDVIGVHGHIGEIRTGAYKGAPKTYTVDYQHPKHSSHHTSSIQLSKEHIRGAKPGTLGEDLDEAKLTSDHTFQVGDVVDVNYHDINGKYHQGTANVDKASSAYVHITHPSHGGVLKFHQGVGGKGGAEVGTYLGSRAGGHKITLKGTVKEGLDELSKKTLGSYINKASFDATDDATHAEFLKNSPYRKSIRNTSNGYQDYSAKATEHKEKRLRGVGKAVSKLTKEDLDELSVDTMASYASKAREDALDKVKTADRQAKSSSSVTLNKALQNYRDATKRNTSASKAETKARGKQMMDVNK